MTMDIRDLRASGLLQLAYGTDDTHFFAVLRTPHWDRRAPIAVPADSPVVSVF